MYFDIPIHCRLSEHCTHKKEKNKIIAPLSCHFHSLYLLWLTITDLTNHSFSFKTPPKVLKTLVFAPSLEVWILEETQPPRFLSYTRPMQVGEKPGNEVGGNSVLFAAQCIMSHIPSKAGVNSSRWAGPKKHLSHRSDNSFLEWQGKESPLVSRL